VKSNVASFGAYSVSLAEWGGAPIISRAGFGQEPDFYWAKKAQPNGTSDWCADLELIDQLSSLQPHLAISVFNGLPVIACYNSITQVVVIMGK
jgi:hypothetical protein